MFNLNKTVKIHIDPKFDADQWQLYTAGMKCARAANALNAALKKQVNSGASIEITRRAVIDVMVKHAKYGAYDTEPMWFLDCILNEVYKPR